MNTTRVLVADDHPIFRDGVVQTLEEQDDIAVVAIVASATEAIDAAKRLKPDIALLDVSMPGSGITAAEQIRDCSGQTRVVMLTVSENDGDVLQALEAGACGYVLKGVSGTDLVTIIRKIAQGESFVSPSLAAGLLMSLQSGATRERTRPELTPRETDILELVSRGKSNKEIGLALSLQEKTVKHYMTAIMMKLNVRNRVEAAIKARELL